MERREELMETMKKVVIGFDKVEEERNVAWGFLIWHNEMSPMQEVWRNCGQ